MPASDGAVARLGAEAEKRSSTEGLSRAEVAERRSRGQVNDVPASSTHSVPQILRANILTPFNALLGGLLAVILVVGPLQDALFGLVLIANSLTGIIQELRAKRALDHLTVVNAPRARVIRGGVTGEVPLGEVVLDDLLDVRTGDQIVVDAIVVANRGLEIDESLLTGESDPVVKEEGDRALSGSFVVAGGALIRADRVGRDAYAQQLTEEARKLTRVHSELRSGLDRIIRLVAWAMLPTAGLLLYSQVSSHPKITNALRGTVAGVVAMVPEGLVLLTSVAFAVGIVRLSRRKTLVQELAAVETLARVDVICVDKTGTLTSGEIAVDEIEHLGEPEENLSALAALAAADPDPNATLMALRAAWPDTDWDPVDTVPFSSARKWSAARFEGHATWIVGAPEILLSNIDESATAAVGRKVEEYATAGHRVLLLARSDPIVDETLPPTIEPRAIVTLSDRMRPDAADTIAYFDAQGVAVKVISGDHPRTVAAIAGRASVPHAGKAIDARSIGEDVESLRTTLEENAVFGRVTPHQKRAMVKALQSGGHVVAMTGDGVNDVLALKDADIGIAMGAGSSASRGAAQLVLLDNSFASMPAAVAEGRRVINNIERVANLFLTKTVYSMVLALAIAAANLPFPFLPRHLTLIGSLTIGIPAFFLALVPNRERARSGFVDRVLRFALPVGVLAAAATFTGYYIARARNDVSLDESRTTATIILLSLGLLIFADLAGSLEVWRARLLGAMVTLFLAVLLVPPLTRFFAVELPPPMVALMIAVIVAVTYPLMHLCLDLVARAATRRGVD